MSESGKVVCQSCKKVITYPPSKAGLTGKCPGCGNKITLPQLKKATEVIPSPAAAEQLRQIVKVPVAQVNPVVQTQVISQVNKVAEQPIADVVDSEISRFMSDGQNAAMITKLLDRVKQICTSAEEVLYMAVQQKPIANLSPDAIVLTSRRAIVFRQKLLGTMEFVDVAWAQIQNVHVKENLIGATVSITGANGHTETVDYLPKDQARRVYRYGQEMEEKMIEWRRQRKMEEDRNAADQVIVNTAVASPTNPVSQSTTVEDPLQRLSKLKAMLDAGLIDQNEFDTAKARILSSI